jgi:transposase
MERVIIGVDPHKLSATIEVIDAGENLLGSGRFTTDKAGFAAMRKYVASWRERTWAVEGSLGVGRPLAQRLLELGEHVVDVPAKLAARVRIFDTGHNRKTDARDAHSIAVVAARTKNLRVLAPDGELEALRMLVDRRDELSRQRVQTVNRLQRLLAELTPGQAKKDITALQAKAILASVRPRDVAGKTRRRVAVDELADLVAIEKKVKALTVDIKAIVEARGSNLMDLPGVGPIVAARVLADVGDVARFADRNRFASWTGTAPLDASSGEQNRHRLSRAGNRRMNRKLHIAATTQIRLDTEGRAYYRRKLADGKTRMEAMRCLKRRISDAVYRQLRADAAVAAIDAEIQDADCSTKSGGHGPGRALRGDSRIQRGRPTPAHRHFGSATSRTRRPDGTPTPATPEQPCGPGSQPSAPARRSRQGGAPHRTNGLDGDKRWCTLKGNGTAPLTTEGSRKDALQSGRSSERIAADNRTSPQ